MAASPLLSWPCCPSVDPWRRGSYLMVPREILSAKPASAPAGPSRAGGTVIPGRSSCSPVLPAPCSEPPMTGH
ncbi:hypothetical protein RAA17_23770 [Komagataeibacter rhaeticus]|nr:hypothetical protein [Komagataeibacter rhaeticus]